MKKLIKLIVLLPILAIGQTTTQNYTKATAYKVATTTSIANPTINEATQQITYFDGLGRPIQQIAKGQSGTGNDIVTHIEYDAYGRQVKDYLPYASGQNNMAYINVATVVTNLQSQYQSWYGDVNPYSEKQLEASPLNRVFKQAAPGNDWAMSGTHQIKLDYQTNTANEVKLYIATATWDSSLKKYDAVLTLATTNGGNYNANELYKTITFDENTPLPSGGVGGGLEEFKDKEGKVVLKRAYITVSPSGAEGADTYYVYDQYGNLSFVIPPAVTNPLDADQMNGLCYQYKYDSRNRLVEKKLPGKQWEFIVYDKLDRVVATGPAFAPFTNLQAQSPAPIGWMITKYDAFSRPVYTGWAQATAINATERATIQTNINALTNFNENKTTAGTIDGVACFYTNNITVTTGAFKLLTVNYYDDYNFPNAPAIPATVTNSNDQAVYYNNTDHKPKGMPTGSWVRVLQNTTSYNGETSYTLYDNKARPVRTYTKNYLGGYTQTDSKIDFAGKTLFTETKHKRTAGDTELLTTEYFTYTDQDRLLTQTHKINNEPIQLIAHNTYTELGQLKNKKVGGLFPSSGGVPAGWGGTTATPSGTGWLPLQSVDYQYNIRGWLTGINDINTLTDPLGGQDLFAFKINYNTIDNGQAGVQKLYNGNIAETRWRTNSDNMIRSYGYSYDNLNRLTNAQYIRPTLSGNADVEHSFDETLTYDKNGNIQSLVRNGGMEIQSGFNTIDDLAYTYNPTSPNQLLKVEDATNDTDGFKNGTNTNDDYSYDLNGNMIKDENKGIQTIKYNHLNLPSQITFTGTNRKINYLYTATGQKVQKVVNDNLVLSVTDYMGGYQYNNAPPSGDGGLQFFPHGEGYVKNTLINGANSYDYVFSYLDHLGNVRLNYGMVNGVLTKFEENNYYPFGLKHKNYNYNLREIQEKKETIVLQEADAAQGIEEIKQDIFEKASLQKEEEYFEKMAAIRNLEPVRVDLNFVPNSGYQKRFQSKNWEDELDLNVFDFGARQFDPAIVRTTTHDPLAEKFYSLSPQSFLNNNPLSFIDPTGMLAEDKKEEKYSDSYYEKEANRQAAITDEINEGFKKYFESQENQDDEGQNDPPNSIMEFLKNLFRMPKSEKEAEESHFWQDFLNGSVEFMGEVSEYYQNAMMILSPAGEITETSSGAKGLYTVVKEGSSKYSVLVKEGSATSFYKTLNPSWNGAMTKVDAAYSTTSFTAQNGIRATLSTTSRSTGMATIKLAQKGFEIILRFPNF